MTAAEGHTLNPHPPLLTWDYMSGEQWHATQLKIHEAKSARINKKKKFLCKRYLKLFYIYRINEILSLCMENIWLNITESEIIF